MQVKSVLRFCKIAPDKIRVLSSLVKDKKYEYALGQLQFANKAGATPLSKILKTAKAQAQDKNLNMDSLIVKEIRVDEGPKLKRRRICSKGRATNILKRMSHVTIILEDNQGESQKSKVKSEEKILKKAEDKRSA